MKTNRIKEYIILIEFIIIGILLLLQQCSSPKIKQTFIKGKESIKYDTIHRPYKVVEFKKLYYPKWDTTYIDTSKNLPNIQPNLVRVYNDSLTDTNLTIFSNLEALGMIKSNKLSYRLKTPLEVIKTVKSTDTIIRPNTFDMYLTGEVGGSKNSFNTSVGVDIRIKKVIIGYRYGVIDQTNNIKIGYAIFKSKK